MSYARVIVNPFARSGVVGKKWPQVSELLRDAGLSFEYDFTEGVGHGIELAKEAVGKGHKLVIAVGGDGTVNEVVNGLVDESGKGRATLGIVNFGTGRDIARMLGIPRDYVQACRLFSCFKRVTIDLGAVEYVKGNERRRRLLVNTASLGFEGAVIERVRGPLRRTKGITSYVIALLLTLPGYCNKQVTLDLNGAKEKQRVFSIVINNGCYYAGPMKIAPGADPCDGFLDVVVVGDMGKVKLVWTLRKLHRGTHIARPMVSARQAKSIQVDSAERLLLQVDGELLGEAPAAFSILPAALTVAILKGGPFDRPAKD